MVMKKKSARNQRGVALFLAIFALLLISSIALAMLFSSNSETVIAANYRDKQVSTYAVLSGLQEARARIHPLNGDMGIHGLDIVPKALPSLAAKNVLYIINPAPGETVAPWDPTNQYFDTELCHENILGLTPSNGPCPTSQIPAGTGWFKCYDNSGANPDCATSTTPWQLQDAEGHPSPLSYKWVRVTLKADGMTPVPIHAGSVAAGTQVCWNGTHEVPRGAGYNNDCTPPSGGVAHIAITAPGSGYTGNPIVTISGGGGTGATAEATIGQLPTAVTTVTLTNAGSGYTSQPTVTIVPVDGNGGGATAAAALNNKRPVHTVSIQNAGVPSCYQAASASHLTANFVNPADGGATGTVNMTGNKCIYGLSYQTACAKNTTYTVTAGGGFSATIAFTNNKSKGTVVLTNPGDFAEFATGAPPALTVTPACALLKPAVDPGVQIHSVTVNNGGSYSVPPGVTFSGATAADGSIGNTTGTTTLQGASNPSQIQTLTLTNGGSGYTADPNVVISAPDVVGGTQATATASITPSDGVISITITSAGSGYTSAPTVTIANPGGGGTTATAKATLGSGGDYLGSVYLLTSMAVTPTGAKSTAQMEVAVTYDKFSLNLGGALTLAGPTPTFGTPNSQNFQIVGKDANSCGESFYAPKPAIGVYDDPDHPTEPTSVASVLSSLGKPNNYFGAHSAPDVENAFGNLGSATPQGFQAFSDAVRSVATHTYTGNVSNVALGSAASPIIDFVDGNYTMGPQSGYGILFVTGTLTISGNYDWHGLIFVIGAGASVMNGGGNGQVTGAVFVANTNGPTNVTLGSPDASWNGGGGNGVQYDHCWADNMLAKVPFKPSINGNDLAIISLRVLEF